MNDFHTCISRTLHAPCRPHMASSTTNSRYKASVSRHPASWCERLAFCAS